MSGLQEYLVQKRQALLRRRERASSTAANGPLTLSAHVRAEDRSGVRRIRSRDFQILSDSGPDFAGYSGQAGFEHVPVYPPESAALAVA